LPEPRGKSLEELSSEAYATMESRRLEPA
jgi:hypothetical protein